MSQSELLTLVKQDITIYLSEKKKKIQFTYVEIVRMQICEGQDLRLRPRLNSRPNFRPLAFVASSQPEKQTMITLQKMAVF